MKVATDLANLQTSADGLLGFLTFQVLTVLGFQLSRFLGYPPPRVLNLVGLAGVSWFSFLGF